MHLLVRLEAGGDVVDGEVGGVLAEVEHVHHHLLEGVVVFLRRAVLYYMCNYARGKIVSYFCWINLHLGWHQSLGIFTVLNFCVRAANIFEDIR